MATNTAVHPTMEPGRRALVLALQDLTVVEHLPKMVETRLLHVAVNAACGVSPVEELAEDIIEQAVLLRRCVDEGFDSGRGLGRIAGVLDAHAAALLKVIDPPQPEWFEAPRVPA